MKNIILFLFLSLFFSCQKETPSPYITIPDFFFEQKLIDLGIDSDKKVDGKILRMDAEKVDSLIVKALAAGSGKVSLKGIEGFSNLKYLDCSHCQIDSLDVSQNTKLETLVCNGDINGGGIFNNVTNYLKLNKNLKYLSAWFTSFPKIENGLPKTLQEFYLANDSYQTIDISQCKALEKFKIGLYFTYWHFQVCVYGMEQVKNDWTKENQVEYKLCK